MRIISGLHRQKPLLSPKTTATRPTSSKLRAAVFNICQNEIEGGSFLDLFAGSGAMGLEALSRGAKKAVFVENDRQALRCLLANIEKLQEKGRAEVLAEDAFHALERLEKRKERFTHIYADAPYRQMGLWKGQKILLSHKVLFELDERDLLAEGGVVFLEDASKEFEGELQNLHLKNCRRMGHTYLRQYITKRKA